MTQDYESEYAVYHFDEDIPAPDRDTCVFYSDALMKGPGWMGSISILVRGILLLRILGRG